jgi:hypothetical protein
MTNDIDNPLSGVEIGTTIEAEHGTHRTPVLQHGLTRFLSLPTYRFRLTGTSDYVYSSTMNQASLSVSGGYGLSGLSKVSAALTAFGAHTATAARKHLLIHLNCIKSAGIEYIDFDSINLHDVINQLKPTVKDNLLQVLDAFNQLTAACNNDTARLHMVLDTPTDPLYQSVFTALDNWFHLSKNFQDRYGTGLVVGVLWGSWGSVDIDILRVDRETAWQVGASAQFEYEQEGADLRIGATYGHSEDIIGQHATATISASVNGNCLLDAIQQWAWELSDIALGSLNDLGNQPVTRSDVANANIGSPTIPQFVGTGLTVHKEVTTLFGSLNASALEGYSQVRAWAGQVGSKGTLSNFLTDAAKLNDPPTLDVSANRTLKYLPTRLLTPVTPPTIQSQATPPSSQLASPPTDLSAPPGDSDGGSAGDFEAMGMWVANWSDLFPWLCTGYSNELPADSGAQRYLDLRTLHQDFLSLASLYWEVDDAGLIDPTASSFGSIGDDFSHASTILGSFIAANKGLPTAEEMVDVLTRLHLSAEALSVYARWNTLGIFRSCNLGVGIMIEAKFGGSNSPASRNTIGSLVRRGSSGTNEIRYGPSSFDARYCNYQSFARSVKGTPLVLPGGDVVLYVRGFSDSSGDTNDYRGILGFEKMGFGTNPSDISNLRISNASGADTWLAFDMLSGGRDEGIPKLGYPSGSATADIMVDLYPLPFWAAQGVSEWRGPAAIDRLSDDLSMSLTRLKEELGGLKKWSFDSERWTDRPFTVSPAMRDIPATYVGLQPSPLGQKLFG